jgi:hypothetical protein
VWAFALRIQQADLDRLPDILKAVPQERRREMQQALARVWQRCVQVAEGGTARTCSCLTSLSPAHPCRSPPPICPQVLVRQLPPYAAAFRQLQAEHAAARDHSSGSGGGGGGGKPQGAGATAEALLEEPSLLPAAVPDLDPTQDDAFATIMGWLHSRIEATR